MRKLLKYISAPYPEYQPQDGTFAWIGGGKRGTVFVDAIIGFEEDSPCDKGDCTRILLATGKSRVVMDSIDEWIQKVAKILENEDRAQGIGRIETSASELDEDRIERMVMKIMEASR